MLLKETNPHITWYRHCCMDIGQCLRVKLMKHWTLNTVTGDIVFILQFKDHSKFRYDVHFLNKTVNTHQPETDYFFQTLQVTNKIAPFSITIYFSY